MEDGSRLNASHAASRGDCSSPSCSIVDELPRAPRLNAVRHNGDGNGCPRHPIMLVINNGRLKHWRPLVISLIRDVSEMLEGVIDRPGLVGPMLYHIDEGDELGQMWLS